MRAVRNCAIRHFHASLFDSLHLHLRLHLLFSTIRQSWNHLETTKIFYYCYLYYYYNKLDGLVVIESYHLFSSLYIASRTSSMKVLKLCIDVPPIIT